MNLADLKKLEGVPLVPKYMFGFFSCEDMDEIQTFCEQVGFDFAVPKHDKCECRMLPWPDDEKIYLYLVMKELYGPPATPKVGSSPLTSYILTSGSSLFVVTFLVAGAGDVGQCFLNAMGEKESLEKQVQELERALKKEIVKYKNTQQLASSSVPRTYFENPFHFYFQQGKRQLDVISKHNYWEFDKGDIKHEINKLNKDLKSFESDDSNSDEDRKAEIKRDIKGLEAELDNLELYWGTLDDRLYEAAAFFLFIASFEGFLNLFYEIYLRRELREDTEIKKNIQKSSIYIKLRTMPVYCNCFTVRLIELDETFKKIQAIFVLRNDLIHANMTSAMQFKLYDIGDMTFYEHENKNKTQPKYDLPLTAGSLTVENLRFISGTVEEMVEKIMASMKPEYKQALKQVLHQDGFYVRLVDGEYDIEVDKI